MCYLIQIAFALYFLVFVSSQRCPGAIKYYPCTTDNKEDGFRCKPNDVNGNSKCVSSKYWCTSVAYDEEKHRCGDVDTNLILKNCFQIHFNYKDAAYVAVRAGASWSAAKQYCEEYGKGYNVISFTSTNEFNDIVTKLKTFIYKPTDMIFAGNDGVFDYFGDVCPGSKPFDVDFHTDAISFWTGGYINYLAGGTPAPSFLPFKKKENQLERKIYGVKDKNGVALIKKYRDMKTLQCPESGACVANETRIKFDVNKGVWGHSVGAFLPKVDSDWTRASILCKKEAKGGITPPKEMEFPSTCLTGFKCPNSDKCLTGALYKDSELCDGVKDCPDGQDENKMYCNYMPYKTGIEEERWHFFNLQHTYDTAKRFCESEGWVLPSLKKKNDIQVFFTAYQLSLYMQFVQQIANLPGRYYETEQKKSPFNFRMNDWNLKSWTIYLGATTDSKTYTDGTPVTDYRNKKGKDGVYVVKVANEDGTMDTMEPSSRDHSVFVCLQPPNVPTPKPEVITTKQPVEDDVTTKNSPNDDSITTPKKPTKFNDTGVASVVKTSCLIFIMAMLNLLFF